VSAEGVAGGRIHCREDARACIAAPRLPLTRWRAAPRRSPRQTKVTTSWKSFPKHLFEIYKCALTVVRTRQDKRTRSCGQQGERHEPAPRTAGQRGQGPEDRRPRDDAAEGDETGRAGGGAGFARGREACDFG